MVKVDKWIQRIGIKRGALRRYVRRIYGSQGFDNDGRIKVSVLKALANAKNVSKTTRARARLALRFRGFKKKVKRNR